MAEATLTVVDLRAGYGAIPILRGLSFAVARGERIGIKGHNGMGKTTLLRTIVGLNRTDAGSIRIDGSEIGTLAVAARARLGLGYVPQGRQIFSELTAAENLAMGAIHLLKAERIKRVSEVLTYFPRLERLLPRKGGLLSGGEQQLLALARCLCAKPRIMLLDEPTEGIQPSTINEIAKLLVEISVRENLTLITVEQNAEFLASVAQRTLEIERGKIVGERVFGQELQTVSADIGRKHP